MMNKRVFQSKLNESLHRFKDTIAIECGNRFISYGELNQKSDSIKNRIKLRWMNQETFIGIFIEDRVEFITAMIGILKARCVFVPFDVSYPLPRLKAMIRAVEPCLVISDKANYHRLSMDDKNSQEKAKYPVLLMEDLVWDEREVVPTAEPDDLYNPEDKIYIYFTSGSTGEPKAILGKNKSLLHFIEWEIETFVGNKKLKFSQFTNVGFDAFLRDVFVPLCSEGTICIPGNERTPEILSPEGLSRFIDKYDINLIHSVPSLFDLINNNHITGDNFKNLEYILLSGERIKPEKLKSWFNIFKHRVQLVNFYGPTETTMIKTFYFIREEDVNIERIPIGKPMKGARVIILDKELNPCGENVVGELYIRTPYRTYGYYNSPDSNKRVFLKNPFTNDNEDILYKTGDLGRLLPDGNIDLVGRIDRQVKIHGVRVELGEIENKIMIYNRYIHSETKTGHGFEKVKDVAVTCRYDENENIFPCAYIIPGPGYDEPGLWEYLKQELPPYMVPKYFVKLDKLPLMFNGKIDMKSLPEPKVKEKKKFLPPGNPQEKKLVGMWAEVLNKNKEDIDIESRFIDMGGHSLNIMNLITKIHKEFDVRISLGDFFQVQTIKGLERYLKEKNNDKYFQIKLVELKEYYSLLSAQKRLYALQGTDPGNTSYNMPQIFQLEIPFCKEKLDQAFNTLIQRHENLRTSFELKDGEPVQMVHRFAEIEFEIEYFPSLGNNPSLMSTEKIIKDFIRPFNLSLPPLLRVGIIGIEPEKHILMLDMHHIISDGISLQILSEEFIDLYEDKELPGLRLNYKDYVQWHSSDKQRILMKEQELYWLERFQGELPVLELPLDYKRPMIQSFEGNTLTIQLNESQTRILKTVANDMDATLYMVILSIYTILLSRLSGQEDIIVGTPTAGRCHADIERIIGMFVNTLVIRNNPHGNKTFKQFLKDIKENTLTDFENQDYHFENLLEKLSVKRDTSRNPLFDTMFVFQNIRPADIEPSVLKVTPYPYENKTAKFDLTFTSYVVEEKLLFEVEYGTALFKRETIERFITYFKELVSGVIENPGKKILEIEIISGEERNAVLYKFNDTYASYPRDRTLHQLFSEQASKNPDAIAVNSMALGIPSGVDHVGTRFIESDSRERTLQLTYHQLNRAAEVVAQRLLKTGVGPDNIAGIMIERSAEMIAGLLGILKAGAAYLPIATVLPGERKQYMLKDSCAKVLLDSPGARENFELPRGLHLQSIDIEKNIESIHGPSPSTSTCRVSSTNLAYVIYTSGSTGKAKGVMMTHQSVHNLLVGLRESVYKNYPTHLKVCLLAPYEFDASVQQIFGALLQGHTLYIVPEETRMDGFQLLPFYKKNQIDISDGTPSHLRMLVEALAMDNQPHTLAVKHFIIAGEKFPLALAARFLSYFTLPRPRVSNIYGPTETCVDSTFYHIVPEKITVLDALPIGIPLSNQQVYILDKGNQLLPIGVSGELCIGGDGVAQGYLNRPGLTAEKFVNQVTASGGGSGTRCINKKFLWGSGGRFLQKEPPGRRRQKIYHTGDLARWQVDGNIEFLGRKDFQVKIRGFRIELGEIEMTLNRHPYIRESLVVAVEQEGMQEVMRLAAYIITQEKNKGDISVNEIRKFLKSKLPVYMVPSAFLKLDKFPLLPGGKIDRRHLPAPGFTPLETGQTFVPPRTPVEEKLAKIWAAVLGIEKIGVNDNFFELGGDSIVSLKVVVEAKKKGVEISSSQIFKHQTIEELAAVAKTSANLEFDRQGPREIVSGQVPLSPIQHWYFDQDLSESHHFNQSVILEVNPTVTFDIVERALRQLLIHHDTLRMRFNKENSNWLQEISGINEIDSISRLDLSGICENRQKESIEAAAMRMQTGLNLLKGPLMRAAYFYLGEDKPAHLLLIIHHLVVDGVSWRILLSDLELICRQLSNGEPVQLPSKTTSYKEWAEFLVTYAQSDSIKERLSYWLSICSKNIAPLPVDFPGNKTKQGGGVVADSSAITVKMNQAGTRALLREVHQTFHTQVNDLLLTALHQAFAQWTGERILLIEMERHGREEISPRFDLTRTVGWFTAIFPVLLDTRASRTPADQLKSIKEQLRQIPGRGLNYGLLRYLLGDKETRESLNRLPRPKILFNYLGQVGQVSQGTSLFKPSDIPTGPNRSLKGKRPYLLEINGIIVESRLHLEWTYNKNLHRRATVEKLATASINALRDLIDLCKTAKMEFTPSDFPLVQLDCKKLARVTDNNPGIENIYPLTPMQQQTLSYNIFTSGTGANIQQLSWEIKGDLNISAFQAAWQMVVKQHALLRTAFKWKGLKEPLQVVYRSVEIPFLQLDCRKMTDSQQKQFIDNYIEENKKKGFKISQIPLMRLYLISLNNNTCRVIWSYSTSLFDNWSGSLILTEVFHYYNLYSRAKPVTEKKTRPFVDYVKWLKKQEEAELKRFWQYELQDFHSTMELGIKRISEDYINKNFEPAQRHIRINKYDTQQLRYIAQKYGLTLWTLLQGAWVITLSHFNGEEDVLSGVLTYGRPPEIDGIESIVGLFINILPVRTKVSDHDDLFMWLREFQDKQVRLRQFEFASVEDISTWSGVPLSKIQKAIYERTFVLVKSPEDEFFSRLSKNSTMKISHFHNSLRLNVPLRVYVEPSDTIIIKMKYDRTCFDPGTIAEVAGYMERLFKNMATNTTEVLEQLKAKSNIKNNEEV